MSRRLTSVTTLANEKLMQPSYAVLEGDAGAKREPLAHGRIDAAELDVFLGLPFVFDRHLGPNHTRQRLDDGVDADRGAGCEVDRTAVAGRRGQGKEGFDRLVH